VQARDIHWFIGGLEEPVKSVRPPNAGADVQITIVPETATLDELMARGDIDAMLVLQLPPGFTAGAPHIARLFPDYKRVEIDYYRRTGIFPVMHTVAIRKTVLDRDPWIAKSLYDAFVAARDIALHGLYDTDALHLTLPFLIDHVEETLRIFGADYFSYGLAPTAPASMRCASISTSRISRRTASSRRICSQPWSNAPSSSPSPNGRGRDPSQRDGRVRGPSCGLRDELPPLTLPALRAGPLPLPLGEGLDAQVLAVTESPRPRARSGSAPRAA